MNTRSKKRSLEVVEEVKSDKVCKVDVSCSVCKELMYEPRVFQCGHSVCFVCFLKLKRNHPLKCPECRSEQWTDCQRNHTLRNIIESLHPTEYARRKDNCVALDWLYSKGFLFSIDIRTSLGTHAVLPIVKALDKADVWDKKPDCNLLRSIFTSPGSHHWIQGYHSYYSYGMDHFMITWKNSTIFCAKPFQSGDWIQTAYRV